MKCLNDLIITCIEKKMLKLHSKQKIDTALNEGLIELICVRHIFKKESFELISINFIQRKST